jgi:hypothetical protein
MASARGARRRNYDSPVAPILKSSSR